MIRLSISALETHRAGTTCERQPLNAVPAASDIHTARRAISDNIRQQLEAVGITAAEALMNAEVVAARYVARGERLGMEPLALFSAAGIEVGRGSGHAALGVGDPAPSIASVGISLGVDPNADAWTLYHGTSAREDFKCFDPKKDTASPVGDEEHGVVFFTPDAIVAQRYARYDSSASADDAHRRIIPVRVAPGKTRLFDVPDLLSRENAEFREALHDVGVSEAIYQRMRGVIAHAGVLDYEKGGVVHAALNLARREDLDTAILRGLNDAGTADQIVVLKPGNVTAAYTGDTLFQGPSELRRGSITLGRNRAIVRLFTESDASTFMHEMAHQWLGEMIQDAHVNAASKTDLSTVLSWLGVDDPAKIGRKEQEQWAQGFEQYLRAGKAPSLELESVFQHFKAWLFHIYESIDSLGTPISEEVRGVMDRMLSGAVPAPPDTTVAATFSSRTDPKPLPASPGV